MTTGVFRCAYTGGTKGSAYEAWREQFARRWLSADFEAVSGDRIVNELTATQHSFLSLCNMRSTPVRIERRDDAANAVAGSRFLIVASGTPLRARQRGRLVDVPLGRMILLSADEPAQLTQLAEGDRWSIRISQKMLRHFSTNADDKVGRQIEVGPELARLLLHQIETAQKFGPTLDANANFTMAQHVLDLIALCLGAGSDAAHLAERRGLAAARFDAIKADILRRLGTTKFELVQIAADHGMSTRYVQHLFERSGTSFTDFVLEQRLSLAHRLLREPKNSWRKISDIATVAGFSDISYFNRSFRARFGATPTEVRRGR